MADFTSRFNELLTRFPGSDTELAEALDVSKQTISAWKNGVRFPKKPVLRTISEYFNVSIPWLEGISDDETIYNTSDNGYVPQTIEARIVSGGMDKLPEAQRQQILGVVRAMFANDPDLFKDGDDK